MSKTHKFINSDPTNFDSNCSVCGGKERDYIHKVLEGVKHYEHIGKDDPLRQAKLKAQREEFEQDAQSGKMH